MVETNLGNVGGDEMNNKKNKFNSESGASILEILMVVAVGAILVGVAVSQFGNSRMQLQRQNLAREFKNNLERCRFDSVRRRADDSDFANMSQIVIRSNTSYDVMIDSNQDGIISSQEVRTIDFSGRSDAKIIPASGVFPITVRFNRRGHITSDSLGTPVTPLFTICSGNCTAATTITPENSNVISISPTGTVSMLYGGDTIPPLNAPNISTVNSNSDINLWLTVMPSTSTPTPTPSNSNSNTNSNSVGNSNSSSNSNGNANLQIVGSPTPTSTVTPAPTATATPVSTPTPQATPIPTPTPTPNTLRECSLNEKPGSPAVCQCSSPRYVRTNGKCQ